MAVNTKVLIGIIALLLLVPLAIGGVLVAINLKDSPNYKSNITPTPTPTLSPTPSPIN